ALGIAKSFDDPTGSWFCRYQPKSLGTHRKEHHAAILFRPEGGAESVGAKRIFGVHAGHLARFVASPIAQGDRNLGIGSFTPPARESRAGFSCGAGRAPARTIREGSCQRVDRGNWSAESDGSDPDPAQTEIRNAGCGRSG